MGLEGVELVMEIEEEFGIVLDDEDIGLAETIGDIIRIVEKRFSAESRQRVGVAFYRLRQVLADSALIEKRRVRPSTDLRPLIPRSQLQAVWREVDEAGFRVPPLVLSPVGVGAFVLLWLILIFGGAQCMVVLSGGTGPGAIVALPMFFFGWFPALRLTEALARSGLIPSMLAIPASQATVGALARRWRDRGSEQTAVDADNSAGAVEAAAASRRVIGRRRRSASPFRQASESDSTRAARAMASLRSVLTSPTKGASDHWHASVDLAEMIPRRDRWRIWSALTLAGVPTLPLELTRSVRNLIRAPVLIVAMAGTAATLLVFVLLLDVMMIFLGVLATAIGLILVLLIAVASHEGLAAFGRAHHVWWLVSEIPEEWRTLEEAAKWTAARGWPSVPVSPELQREGVGLRVRQVVAELVSVPVERITPDTRLTELGI